MKIIFFFIALLFAQNSQAKKILTVHSPDNKINVSVTLDAKLSYTISYMGNTILQPSFIDIILNNGKKLTTNLNIARNKIESFDETIISPVPEKRKQIRNKYNQLTIQFKEPFTLLV